MADRPTDGNDKSTAEIWDRANPAGQDRILRNHGPDLVEVALSGQGSLRTAQLPPPGDWAIWAVLAGRGFGKTRAGAEWVHALAAQPGRRFALVGATLDTARAVMVEGESGLHRGSETQDVDPLIAAAEGGGGAPAYRGIAYAVFEDMPLAEYGDRLPNLTFEVVADLAGADVVRIALDQLGRIDGKGLVAPTGDYPAIAGYHSGRSGTVAEALAPLIDLANATVAGDSPIGIRAAGGSILPIPGAECDSMLPNGTEQQERRQRAGIDGLATAMEIAFYDTSRDYQVGLQRVRRGGAGAVNQRSFAAAMTPQQAKSLAATLLSNSRAARATTSVRLPWRHLAIAAGDLVRLPADAAVWRVRERRFANFVVVLALEQVQSAPALLLASDGGRPLRFDEQPAGPTHLEALDLPPLSSDLPMLPRLWLTGAGASPGWRRVAIEASGDEGARYSTIGTIERTVPQGFAIDALPAASTASWDRRSTVDVVLLSDAMWLESQAQYSVLAGANLALLGDELIQFGSAVAMADGRFRLSGLLRGRRGTEDAVSSHAAGERFIMMDASAMLAFDPPLEALGRKYRFRPAGAGDLATSFTVVAAGGRGLKPLSPVQLRLSTLAGTVHADWIRRSRAGFGWSDFVDAPLAEAIEAYRIEVTLDGRHARSVTTGAASYIYSAADRIADGGGSVVGVAVAQLSECVGPGGYAAASINIG